MRRLLVDGPGMTRKYFKKVGHLSALIDGTAVPTGVAYSLFRSLSATVRNLDIDSVFVMWDLIPGDFKRWPKFAQDMFSGLDVPNESEARSVNNSPFACRRANLPSYRIEDLAYPEEYYASVSLLTDEFMANMGIAQFASLGWEASDLIFSACCDYPDDEIFILSENPKYSCLLSDKTHVISSSDLRKISTVDAIHSKFKLSSRNQLLDAFSLSGLPETGIYPVGEMDFPKAAEFILEMNRPFNELMSIRATPPGFPEDWKIQMKRNRDVISFFYLRGLYGYSDVGTDLRLDALEAVLNKYQFKSVLSDSTWGTWLETLRKKLLLEQSAISSANIAKVTKGGKV